MHRSLESSNRMPEIYAMKSCCRESAEPSWTNRPEMSTGEALASSVQHCNHFINELSPVRFEEIILSSKLTCPENIQVLVDTSILTWSMLVGGMVTRYFAPQEAQPPGVSENTALDGGCPVPPLNDDYRWNCHLGTYHDISKCIPFSDQSWSVVFFSASHDFHHCNVQILDALPTNLGRSIGWITMKIPSSSIFYSWQYVHDVHVRLRCG